MNLFTTVQARHLKLFSRLHAHRCRAHNFKRLFAKGSFSKSLPVYENDSSSFSEASKTMHMEKMEKYRRLLEASVAGGGSRGIERHVKKNKKVLIRDRIKHLLDSGSEFLEIGGLTGFNMGYGDIPAAGLVGGLGKIRGVYCLISGNDATVKGGSYYPITVQKSIRLQEIAEHNRLPTVYLPDSGGAFLPLQSEIFPDKKQGGRGFYNQAVMSSQQIHQIALVCGSCTAGGAYNPTMSDEAIVVDQIAKIFLGGPPLVKAALGEIVTEEELGGAFMHSSVSGCTDYFALTEKEAFQTCRDVVESLNMTCVTDKQSVEPPANEINWDDFLGKQHFSKIDVYRILSGILDGSKFHEFKALYGVGLITGFGYINGTMVGILANVEDILSAEALKGTHFVNQCNRRSIPLIFLQNSPLDREYVNMASSIASDRSKMASAIATANVPKVSFTVSGCYKDDLLVMCGPAFSPNFHFMWPCSETSCLDMTSFSSQSENTHEENFDAFHAAFNNLTDGIIRPSETRNVTSKVLNVFEQMKLNPAAQHVQDSVLRM